MTSMVRRSAVAVGGRRIGFLGRKHR
jgi:hypothetical protein